MSINYKFLQHDQQEAEAFVNVNNVFNKIPWWGANISSGLFSHDDGNLALYGHGRCLRTRRREVPTLGMR